MNYVGVKPSCLRLGQSLGINRFASDSLPLLERIKLVIVTDFQLVAGFLRRLNLSASRIRTGSGDLRCQIG